MIVTNKNSERIEFNLPVAKQEKNMAYYHVDKYTAMEDLNIDVISLLSTVQGGDVIEFRVVNIDNKNMLMPKYTLTVTIEMEYRTEDCCGKPVDMVQEHVQLEKTAQIIK